MTVVIVGAGAAGLVAAAFAAAGGAEVTLIERTADGGRKILISGGGRCNVLPSVLAPERFVTDAPAHLMRNMLRAWPLREQRNFFECDLGIALALEQESGKLFPQSNRAKDIRDGLVAHARERGVRLQFGTTVTGIQPGQRRGGGDPSWSAGAPGAKGEGLPAGFTVQTSAGDIHASRVVLATGGMSVPLTGSDGTGLRIAGGLGHRMIDTYPALTPLLSSAPGHAALSGVSLDVRLRGKSGKKNIETSGGFLFTHRGYSGPSVLDLSHLVTRLAHRSLGEGGTIRAQWCPLDAAAWEKEFDAPSALVFSLVSRHVAARLAERLMTEAGVPADRRTSALKRTERLALIDRLTAYELPISGDEGYKKAEVTGGGVALDEVAPRTLESRRCPGLYFCGEMLDAFGPIGGHNFAWAWATGRAAGLAAGSEGSKVKSEK